MNRVCCESAWNTRAAPTDWGFSISNTGNRTGIDAPLRDFNWGVSIPDKKVCSLGAGMNEGSASFRRWRRKKTN